MKISPTPPRLSSSIRFHKFDPLNEAAGYVHLTKRFVQRDYGFNINGVNTMTSNWTQVDIPGGSVGLVFHGWMVPLGDTNFLHSLPLMTPSPYRPDPHACTTCPLGCGHLRQDLHH